MPPHVEIVFKQLFEELKSMKQQQWTITNYGILILAAIYAVKLPGVPHSQMWLKVVAILTAAFGSFLLESVRKHQAGLQSFRSMRRIEASRRNASALRLRFSQSLASLRQRLSHAKVRSTIQRRGSTTNPFVRLERLTISVSS